MKVLLLNGSPHPEGSTYTALREAQKALESQGVETELMHIGNLDVRGCIACGWCKTHGRCVFNDIVNDVAEKFKDADGLIVGSPVYYAGPNATLTALLTRLFYSTPYPKTMKAGACIVSARRSGTTATFDALNKFFTISGMPVVSSIYWNNIHGNNAQEALQDEEGLDTAYQLGLNMAYLLEGIEAVKEKKPLETGPRCRTNFIR